MTSSITTTGSKVGRARRSLSQLWQVPVFLVGLLALIGVAVSAPWRLSPAQRELEECIGTLRRGLDRNEDPDVLVAQADDTLLRASALPSRAGEVQFLAGSALYRQALQKPAVFASEVWPRAADHLEQALAQGVPDDDRPRLQYRLGYSLYRQNKDLTRAIELMMLAVEKGCEQPLEGYHLLVQANLKLAKPNFDGALSASQRVLDLTPERDIEAISLARLQHGEILFKKDLRSDAFKELERIGAKAPRALRIKARLLQARCCKEEFLWAKAIPIWQELLADAAHIEGNRAYILYEMGWCYHEMRPAKDDETIRVWSDALKAGGPAGQAAGLHLGELRLSMGREKSAQGLADWKQALARVNAPADYKNPYLSLTEVCDLFKHAINAFEEANEPDKIQLVAELYRKIKPGGEAEGLGARAAEARAEQMRDLLMIGDDKVTAEAVQAQFRRAGEAYERAAVARAPGDRAEPLWRGIQCYLAAKDNGQAQKVLHQYVTATEDETRLAEGWYTLGDLYRTQAKKDAAYTAFLKCIQYPNTPFACKSQFWIAVFEIEKKDTKRAYEILHQILRDPGLADREVLEKAQYKLASLLMQMKKYDEAHIHLKECVRLYPENPNVLLAREQLGECYRRLAEKEQVKETEERAKDTLGTPEDQRPTIQQNVRHYHKTRMSLLNDAVRTYQALTDDLESLARSKSLGNLEQVLLRRARFGIGECHLDGEEFEEALREFQTLQEKQRQTLEGFYACLRICNMVDVIAQQQSPKLTDQARAQAKESLRLLMDDLRALPADHELFRQPGVSARADWLRWAEDTQRKLAAPPKSPGGAKSNP